MTDLAIAPEIESADAAEAALKAVALHQHEQERQIADLQQLLKKAEHEIEVLTKRANNAEWKLAQMDKLLHQENSAPAILSSTPLPEQQTAVLKSPFSDSFLLDKTTP